MKYLLEHELLDGDCMTVTGKTLAENLATLPGLKAGQKVVHTLEDPIKTTGHIQILRGNLAPDGAVAKITGKEGCVSAARLGSSTARKKCSTRWSEGEIKKGDVVVIRYEGPKGGPGMPEMLTPTSAIMGAGLGSGRRAVHRRPILRRVARFHRRPHHARSPGRRADRAGAKRRPDHDRRGKKNARRAAHRRRIRRPPRRWTMPPYKATRGTLYKYIKNVKSASEGCVTDE